MPLRADIYSPLQRSGPFPVVLWVPGVVSYDSENGYVPAIRETLRGYVVVVPQYRPAGMAPFPAQLDDLKTAIRWLRANSARLHIDPARVGIWGKGAGAHLAALVGTTANDVARVTSLAGGNAGEADQVQAVVDWAGATDLPSLQSDADATSCHTMFDANSPEARLIGCDPQACSAAAILASAQPRPGAAPFLIVHGANDCAIPATQSRRFHEALRAAGVESTLHIIDGVGAFDSYWSSPGAFAVVDSFIDAHLKSSAPHRNAVPH